MILEKMIKAFYSIILNMLLTSVARSPGLFFFFRNSFSICLLRLHNLMLITSSPHRLSIPDVSLLRFLPMQLPNVKKITAAFYFWHLHYVCYLQPFLYLGSIIWQLLLKYARHYFWCFWTHCMSLPAKRHFIYLFTYLTKMNKLRNVI